MHHATVKPILGLLLLTLASGCSQQQPALPAESGNNLVGLASVINLAPKGNKVRVEDYFVNPGLIDSVACTSLPVHLSADGKFFVFTGVPNRPLGVLQVYSGDTVFALPVRKSARVNTVFSFADPDKKYQTVQIAGDINQWNPQLGDMEYRQGTWQKSFWLPPGPYQYQLVLDGQWALDPANPDSADNNIGGYNSLRIVASPSAVRPKLWTIAHTDISVTIGSENTTEILALWQNQQIQPKHIIKGVEGTTIYIPEAAKNQKRSYIRVYGANENNVGNDLFIPLDYGQVLTSPEQLARSDWHSNILYFMMVDRFFNGDPANDSPLNSPEVNPKADYFGGDIKGITEKIKGGYFAGLGINAIWLSPIVQNPLGAYGLYPNPKTKFSAYHGYWPASWNRVDSRLGSPADLHELVTIAHEHNLNVLIDFVANHVHEEHPIYKQHPEWATSLYLPDGSLNTERWDEYRLTTWFDTFLPTLDLTNPELTAMLTDSAVFWLNEYDLDGFRHDATKHVPGYFWRQLTRKIKQEVVIPRKKTIYQIGETYGSRELIASYINSGEMDAQFDFGVYDNALACFARDNVPFARLQTALNESFKYYGHHHLMGNITGNQDKPRFMAYAGGDLRFDEDSKRAGWTRNITVTNPLGYEKLKSFMAFTLTIPGIPVIYYGDEIGMTGANDPDNRRQMRFKLTNEDEKEVKATVARLTKLRRNTIELSYGDFRWLHVDDDIMAFARTYFQDISVIAFNKSAEVQAVQLQLPATYKKVELFDLTNTRVDNNNGFISLSLQPHSFMIIQTK